MANSDQWINSKVQRAELKDRFGGRCAYCGEVLVKMQADHLKPVTRIMTDPWGRPLPASEQRVLRPENNVVGNMMPACPPCNNSKGGYSLEGWRDLLQRSGEIVARDKSIFRAGVRMGVISISEAPVVFYFEKINQKASQ